MGLGEAAIQIYSKKRGRGLVGAKRGDKRGAGAAKRETHSFKTGEERRAHTRRLDGVDVDLVVLPRDGGAAERRRDEGLVLLLGRIVPERHDLGLGRGAHRDGGRRDRGLALDALGAREGVVLGGVVDRGVGRALDDGLGRGRALGAEAAGERGDRAQRLGLGALDLAAAAGGVLVVGEFLEEVVLGVLGRHRHGARRDGRGEDLAGHRARLDERRGVRALLDHADDLEALRVARRDDDLAHRDEHGALREEAARRAADVVALLVAQEEEGVAEGLLDAVELDADRARCRGRDGLRALVLRRRALGHVDLLGHLGLEGSGGLGL